MSIRAIAFVLPQFHPIPENDEWWGKGFTEWTNVTKAKPLFEGHYQPQLPTDLGFYDLRLPEAREAQAAMAKEYGISGFCYYHYWFNGKRLLNQPVDEILKMGEPDMPFMLCWANENWTRRWDGLDNQILMKQEYSLEDDKEHIRFLCEHVFRDERYIKVNNCPVFAIYDHRLFPNLKATAALWREVAKKEFGFNDLYLCVIESFNIKVDPLQINFDAAIEFTPHSLMSWEISPKPFEQKLIDLKLKKEKTYSLRDYSKGVEQCLRRKEKNYKFYRSVTPSWDNTPRRGEMATLAIGSSPSKYYSWLKQTVEKFKPYSKDENFIFINAMNEWAEGNHLEPCRKFGRQYLEATQKALEGE